MLSVTDISQDLEFCQEGKNIVFTPLVHTLFEAIINTRKGPEAVGTILASYLEAKLPLISTFTWQNDQGYYDRLLLSGSKEHNITLMALIWPEHSFSPIHYHQAWCVFGVYAGTLTETLYQPDNSAITRHHSAHTYAYDDSKEQSPHKLGNAQPNIAVSLHIYGVSPEELHKINCEVGKRAI